MENQPPPAVGSMLVLDRSPGCVRNNSPGSENAQNYGHQQKSRHVPRQVTVLRGIDDRLNGHDRSVDRA
jgi:hypothetical protein